MAENVKAQTRKSGTTRTEEMMIKFIDESDCKGCDIPPCVCCTRQKIVKVCDMCGWEVDDLYQVEAQQICGECRDELFPKVKINRR